MGIIPSMFSQVTCHNIHQVSKHQGDLNIQDSCTKCKLKRKILSLVNQHITFHFTHFKYADIRFEWTDSGLPPQPQWEQRAEVWRIPTGYAIWTQVQGFWLQLPQECCYSRPPHSKLCGKIVGQRRWVPLVPGWTSEPLLGVWMFGWQTGGELSEWGSKYDWRHFQAVVRSSIH